MAAALGGRVGTVAAAFGVGAGAGFAAAVGPGVAAFDAARGFEATDDADFGLAFTVCSLDSSSGQGLSGPGAPG